MCNVGLDVLQNNDSNTDTTVSGESAVSVIVVCDAAFTDVSAVFKETFCSSTSSCS